MSNHHISEDGKTIICTAPPEAECRTRPNCDSEEWSENGCFEHRPGHMPVTGQRCYKAECVNESDMKVTFFGLQHWGMIPSGAPVDIDCDVEDGCSWALIEGDDGE